MRIVSWNCNGALRNKFQSLYAFKADIFVIQECENPILSNHKDYQKWANNYLWIGDSKNKGIGVFANDDIKLSALDWSNDFKGYPVKYFLPCRVNNEFNLLAVWTHRNKSPNFGYIGQLWKYLQINRNNLNECIIAGDFNSNVIWDQWDRWWNHSDVVNELKKLTIESFYHKFNNEEQGSESVATLYFQKNINKPYHIDYIFGSKLYLDKLKEIGVGLPKNWLKLSDHMPIYCHF